MSVLTWDQTGSREFEAGVSEAVLYKPDVPGVPWNGVTSIDEGVRNSSEPVYFDGTKFNDLITIGDFNGSLKAFTYPDEFLECEGIIEDELGFMVTGQLPQPFGLSYKTKVGNDVNGIEDHYKIHLLYNLTAIPQQISHQTLSLSTDPIEFEWALTSIPEYIDYYRPTAHIILDSGNFDEFLLRDIEDMLYGTESTDPHMPSLKYLSNYIKHWGRFVITDYGDGTWSAYTPLEGVITMLDSETFQIDTDTAEFIDADSYTISSSDAPEV